MSEFIIGEVAMRFLSQNFRYDVADAAHYAVSSDWSGFEFVTGSDGEPLVMPDGWLTGHLCSHLLDESNADEAQDLLYRATGTVDTFDDYAGCLAYDHGNPKAREAAESISASLADYPILNEEDFSNREHNAAEEVLTDSYNVPEDIVDDVIQAIQGDGHSLCSDCSPLNVEEYMFSLGYRLCVHCDDWLKTHVTGPVCFDCVDIYGSGDAVFLAADTKRHVGSYPSEDELRDAEIEDMEAEDEEEEEEEEDDPNQLTLI